MDQSVFLTCRLYRSLPPNQRFSNRTLHSGQAFAAVDRLLDRKDGPSPPGLRAMILEAIYYHASVLDQFALEAFVVMPNHIHLLITPRAPLGRIARSLKRVTGRRAERMLALSGEPFWHEEVYSHRVRDRSEYERIRAYIEADPVRAGLARTAGEYLWSSAGWKAAEAAPELFCN